MKPTFSHPLLGAVVALAAILLAGAAFAQDDDLAYFVRADAVRGGQNATGPTCVLTPVFKTGEQIVWRAEVFDANTGEKITPERAEDVGMTVTAVLADGKEYEMENGPHPRQEPQIYLWVGAWTIPPVYPTGMLNYEIVVEDDLGNSVTWQPIGQDRPGGYGSLITIENR